MQVFLTHLHSDHISDLPPLYAVGYRTVPLQVWGPSGQHPKYGLNATLEGMKAVSLTVQLCSAHLTQAS